MSWLVEKAHAAYDWGGIFSLNTDQTAGSWQDVLDKIVNAIFIIAGALAVIYLVYSGIIYITAAGNPDNAKKGQQGVINAVIGIAIIFFVYFIIQFAKGLGGYVSGTTT